MLMRCTLEHTKRIRNVLILARCIGANPPRLNMGENLTQKEEDENNLKITIWKCSPEVLPYMPTYEEACRGVRFRPPL